jgi:DNA-binding transcriptional ArsR family regulator
VAVRLLIDGAGPRSLAFNLSPLAELGAALHVLAEPEHHPLEAEWVTRTRAALDPVLSERLGALAALWGSYRLRLLFPLSLAPSKTLEEEFAGIEAMPIDDFVELTAFAVRGGNSGEALRSVRSDKEIRGHFIDRARRRGCGAEEIGEELLADPIAFRARFVDVLRQVAAVALDDVWRHSSLALSRDLVTRRAIATTKGPAQALRSLSGSIAHGDTVHSLLIDKIHHGVVDTARQPLVVVPTLFGWPHLLVKHERGWPAVLQYPIRSRSTTDSTSLALLQRRLSVLADPVRLKVCRAVAREPRTTVDLAEAWGISSAQVSRHLRALREAGLVTSQRNGRFVSYQLDAAALARLGADLIVALLR